MRRVLLVIILALVCALSVEARAKFSGIAQQGGQTITTSGQVSTTKSIKTYPACTISVYTTGTTSLVSLYSNNSGTTKANPFTSDSVTAEYGFYIDNGRYDVRFSGTGITSPFTLTDVPIYDSAIDLSSTSLFGRLKLDTAPASASNPIAVGQNSLLVKNVLQLYNVISYGATANDGVDDTTAIRNAAAAAFAAGQPLFIPAGIYQVNDAITLTSGARVIGVIASNGLNLSQIRLTATNKQIFKILGNTHDVTIQDIELYATSQTGTKGILATGADPDSSQRIDFHHITITHFNRGISVEGTDVSRNWQFSYVSLKDSWLEDNVYGLYLDTINTEWDIDNTEFSTAEDNFGINILNAGQISITNSRGLGTPGAAICSPGTTPNGALADTFIQITGSHGLITVSGSVVEGFRNFLVNDFADYSYPINFFNNNAGALVKLNADCFFNSVGNSYFADNVSAADDVRIWSMGDRWQLRDKCGTVTAALGTFQLSGGARVVFNTGLYGTRFDFPVAFGSAAPDATDPASATNPIVRIGSAVSMQYLLRLGTVNGSGVFQQTYDFDRNGTSGFLDLTGSQAIPNRALNLNMPIQLAGTSSVATSAAGTGLINYNANAGLLQFFVNGGAATNFIGATTALTATRIPVVSSNGIIANGVMTDNGTSVTINGTTGRLISSATTGTSPFSILSLTKVANLNVDLLDGGDWAAPLAIGTTTPAAVTATTIKSTAGISNFFKGADVASAATIVPTGNAFQCTGVTNITAIDSTGITDGTVLHIMFTGVLTVTDNNGALNLAGNFVTTANDTLTVMLIGGNWVELSRSVN